MKILKPFPANCFIAVSGGADSMFGLHFMRNRNMIPVFFHHATEFSEQCFLFLLKEKENFPALKNLIVGHLSGSRPADLSLEEWWRRERYSFFDSLPFKPMVTCHNLNDNLETYLMGVTRGLPRFIPARRDRYIRPFLSVPRSEIEAYNRRHKVSYLNDPGNADLKFDRNRMRHRVIPELLQINPGLLNTFSTMCFNMKEQ